MFGDGAFRYKLQVLRFYMRCRSDSLPLESRIRYTSHTIHALDAKYTQESFPLRYTCTLLPIFFIVLGVGKLGASNQLLTGKFSLAQLKHNVLS